MPRHRILVVEDDPSIRDALTDVLESDQYVVTVAADGREGLERALAEDYDLLLLDLVLPHHDGLEILGAVRQARPTAPIILVTARGSEDDRVRGLALGADDYVVKPFSMRELLARVAAVLRRSPERPLDVTDLRLAEGRVVFSRRSVEYEDGAVISLSDREVDLLHYLAKNRERAVSRDELLSRVWRVNPKAVMTRTIDMHVARVREKLRDTDPPQLILTVRGQGYRYGGAVT